MSIFATDPVGTFISGALDGLSVRQNVIADNVANVDTPNFTATNVEFETSLADAVERGSFQASDLQVTSAATNTPYGENGNNVDLRKEVLAAMQTQYQYQTLTRAAAERLNNLRTAAGSF